MTTDFAGLGLSRWLVDSLRQVSIVRPTGIQRCCIPPILSGRDCIGGARTGSGKTCAFALPILQRLSEDPYGVFALVLTPTRELAIQIGEQFAALGAPVNLRLCTIVGGLDMLEQTAELARRPHVVVATPGRLADIVASNGEETVAGLRRCRYLVMDEADRLLDPCFADPIATIAALLPVTRQTLLFTATVTDPIRQLAERPPRAGKEKPFLHEIASDDADASTGPNDGGGGSLTTLPRGLSQYYQLVPAHLREPYLHELLSLPSLSATRTIVFSNRADTTELLRRFLRALDHNAVGLHARLSQRERLASLARFRSGQARVLVCTDVASRGLDLPAVGCVVNYDLPRDPDDYVHRVGRTARAGRSGDAISFVTQHDVDLVHAIERRCAMLSPKARPRARAQTRKAGAGRVEAAELDAGAGSDDGDDGVAGQPVDGLDNDTDAGDGTRDGDDSGDSDGDDDEDDVPEAAKMQAYTLLDHDAVVESLKTTSKARRTAQVAMAEEGYAAPSSARSDGGRSGNGRSRRSGAGGRQDGRKNADGKAARQEKAKPYSGRSEAKGGKGNSHRPIVKSV